MMMVLGLYVFMLRTVPYMNGHNCVTLIVC